MKIFFKIMLTIICWVISIYLLYEIIIQFKSLDPWGLSFTFFILPLGMFLILFLVSAIKLTMSIIKKK